MNIYTKCRIKSYSSDIFTDSSVDPGGGISLRSNAALGGTIAGGMMLLLLLLFGVCCWGRKRARPKHSQVHFESAVPRGAEERIDLFPEMVHDFREPSSVPLQSRPRRQLLAMPMILSPKKTALKIEVSQRESPIFRHFQSDIIPDSASERSDVLSSQSSPQQQLRLSPLNFPEARMPKQQTECDNSGNLQETPPFLTPLMTSSACSFRSVYDVEDDFTVINPQKLKSVELL